MLRDCWEEVYLISRCKKELWEEKKKRTCKTVITFHKMQELICFHFIVHWHILNWRSASPYWLLFLLNDFFSSWSFFLGYQSLVRSSGIPALHCAPTCTAIIGLWSLRVALTRMCRPYRCLSAFHARSERTFCDVMIGSESARHGNDGECRIHRPRCSVF